MWKWSLLSLLALGSCFPKNSFENANLSQENANLLDGATTEVEQSRMGVAQRTLPWPKGRIHFTIDEPLKFLTKRIREAMRIISKKTCVKFYHSKKNSTEPKIIFIRGKGCYSSVGYRGHDQNLSLGVGCEPIGVILHELVHAIGFEHEQNIATRNNYMTINWKNIWPDAKSQFKKIGKQSDKAPKKSGLDWFSIMLYGDLAGSIDGTSKTWKPKKGSGYVKTVDVENKTDLSEIDYYGINKLYKCRR